MVTTMLRSLLLLLCTLVLIVAFSAHESEAKPKFNPWNLIPSKTPTPICLTENLNCCNECFGVAGSACQFGVYTNNIELQVSLTSGSITKHSKFCVGIDELAQLTIDDSFNSVFNHTVGTQHNYVNVSIAGIPVRDPVSGNATLRPYWNEESLDHAENTVFAGFYVILVEMTNGLITGASFQNTCSKGKCQMGGTTCVDPNSDCGVDIVASPTASRDVKIFVAWTGTDKLRTALQSEGLLPTKYKSFSLSSWLPNIPELNFINEFLG